MGRRSLANFGPRAARLFTAGLATALTVTALPGQAFQIAPLGSSFEASLTRESEKNLARVANWLGLLIKSPVHEELTQLGFTCPVDVGKLADDTQCALRDRPFATPYVIYGVRWNDLPPFQLAPGEGAGCKTLLGRRPACRVDQTVRFSTQPECWYCLFVDAKAKSQTARIAGCSKADGVIGGNLMSRSHFGDLQFLHAMATHTGVAPDVTRREVLDFLEFAWKVAAGELGATTRLREVPIATLQDRFGCSEWTVSDLYILGRNDRLRPMLRHIAFGSVLHLVQDSFSAAHVDRETPAVAEDCPAAPGFRAPGRVREFHTYAAQDDTLHDAQDTRERMVTLAGGPAPDAIQVTATLFSLDDGRAQRPWSKVAPYFECIFALSDDAQPASAGDNFRQAGR